jgi:hypothetical protein
MLCLRSSPKDLARALEITNELLTHPIASLFAHPVDPKAMDAPDYYDLIKTPQDLGTVKSRLERNQYLTLAQWHTDINLIWSNCQTYNGADAFISQGAIELSRIFESLCAKSFPIGLGGWLRRASDLFETIEDLASHPPGSLKREFSGKSTLSRLTPKDLVLFAEAVSMLSARDEVSNLLHMSEMYGLDISTKRNEAYIDMTKISQPLLHRLVKYAKNRFGELHLKYPT